MRKSIKIKLIAIIATVCMLSCIGIGAMALTASADTAPKLEITMQQTAEIRTEAPMGIRFTAVVDNAEALTTYYGEGNVVYGMLITPADYLTEGKTLAFDGGLTEYVEGGSANGTYLNRTAVPNESGKISGNFIGISENNYDRNFAARAYIGVRADENSPFAYTYSDLCSRSVYTVASYATINIDDYSPDVQTYLNGVVSKVHETYTTLKVSLGTNKFDGTNNIVKPVATVSNGVRTIETGVAIASNNMSMVDVKTYEVDTIGNDFTATATIGNLSVDIENLSCTAVEANNVDGDLFLADDESGKVELTLADGANRTNVLQWKLVDNTEYSSANTSINFAEPVAKNLVAGNYISFDYYSTNSGTPSWIWSNGYALLYNGTNADRVSLFDADGYALTGAINANAAFKNQWITIQYQLPENYTVGNSQSLSIWSNNFTWENATVYIDNFKVSSEPIVANTPTSEGTILADQSDLWHVVTGSKASLTWEAGTIGGKTGVFKWSTTTESAVGQWDGKITFNNNTLNSNLLKKDSYLSFDIYADNAIAPIWADANGSTLYLRNSAPDGVRLFNSEGYLITSGSFGAGSFKGQWITVEIKLLADYDFGTYRGLSANALFTKDNPMYIDNVKVSATAKTEPTQRTILADESHLTAGNVYANKKDLVSLTYVAEEIGGKSGVFKWSTNSTTALSGDSAMLIFGTEFKNQMVTGAYLSFDIYLTKEATIYWADNAEDFLYKAYGADDFPDNVKLYDVYGVEIVKDGTCGLFDGVNKLTGQWITVEICLEEDYVGGAWRGLSSWSSTGGFDNTNPIYLDNVVISETALFG